MCLDTPEFVTEFNRLYGCNLGQSLKRQPIEVMIDEAVGRSGENESDIREFINFVFRCIWLPVTGDE